MNRPEMPPCRCGHRAHFHAHPRIGYPTCIACKCPEYRPAETRETLTLAGLR